MQGYIKWVGGALLFALIVISISTCNKYKLNSEEKTSLIVSSQDSIKYFKNKYNENSSQVALLEGDKENLLLIIGKSNRKLAQLIKSGASSGTVYQYVTKYDTINTIKVDTINGKLAFTDSLKNSWIDLRLSLKNDSLYKSIEFRDSLSVSFQKVNQGFLKPKKSVVIVTNSNPYAKIYGLRSFDIPSKRTSFKFWLGVGLGAGAGYLLFK